MTRILFVAEEIANMNLTHSILERDSLTLIKALSKPRDPMDWTIAKTIEKSRTGLPKTQFWRASKIKRVANSTAHALAQWTVGAKFSGHIPPSMFLAIWKFKGFDPP